MLEFAGLEAPPTKEWSGFGCAYVCGRDGCGSRILQEGKSALRHSIFLVRYSAVRFRCLRKFSLTLRHPRRQSARVFTVTKRGNANEEVHVGFVCAVAGAGAGAVGGDRGGSCGRGVCVRRARDLHGARGGRG